MLQRLYIQNYAIIEEIDIPFSGKLNIITGETGAGKSILMGALSLILGNRADTSVLLNREKKCVIEGIFDISRKEGLRKFLDKEELDSTNELVIRREIGVNGKTRAFINDTPVNLDQLKHIAGLIVDLHQQFDTLELADNNFQLEMIDALAGNNDLKEEFSKSYLLWQSSRKALTELQLQKEQFQKEFDYHQFLFNELEEAGFKENELEDLDAELKLQSNAEGIKSALNSVVYDLSGSEQPLTQQVRRIQHQLESFSSYQSELPGILQRLSSTRIELQDIADELEGLNNKIQYDPARIELINERISTGYKLLKKHSVQTTAQLIGIREQLSDKLQAVLNIDESINREARQEADLQAKSITLGEKLHEKRSRQLKPLETDVNQLLVQVGMPNARLKVELKKQTVLTSSGLDSIEFLFDANKSNQFLPVGKVASGGELSRLMLCLKSLVAKKIDLPTMIFDEIDTGISGEAARQVGLIMKDLSSLRQVICITHLPQIAGKADAHYYVYKEIVKDAVKTNIRPLTQEERITAIAKMLSGEKPTAAALENAREMVGN